MLLLAGRGLISVSGLYGNPLASFGATARKNRLPALGFHASAEAVLLGAAATVGLKRALGH
jgi:hypothetical protein